MTTEEYKKAVRSTCRVITLPGPASDNFRDIVLVDWTPGRPGMVFSLGWDYTTDSWIEPSWQYGPAPAWVNAEPYIAELEAAVKDLKDQVKALKENED